jgi:hypothetical protein
MREETEETLLDLLNDSFKEGDMKDKELENFYEDELDMGQFIIPKKRDWSNLPIYLLVVMITGMLIYLYLTI